MSRLPMPRFILPGQDAAPNFDITISGRGTGGSTQLFEAIRPLIASVSYEEDEEMAAMFELTVINQAQVEFNAPTNWNAVLDSKAFQEGNSVDLHMGYGGMQQFMGRVDLVKWMPIFPPSGPGTFTVKGFDGRHQMMPGNQFKVKQTGKARKRRVAYSKQPDEVTVKKIAEKYGFGADTDATEVKKRGRKVQLPTTEIKASTRTLYRSVFPTRVQPADISDWAFLQKLAKINRFDLWVDFSRSKNQYIVHFKKRLDAGQADYLFTYNGDNGSLIEAEPDFAITEQPTDVEVLYYDKRKRNIERTVINDLNEAENLNFRTATRGNFEAKKTISRGARVRFSAFGQVIEAFADKRFRSKKEAETFVNNWLRERESEFLLLRGKVVGIETLRPRQIHQFDGMSKRLNGFYRLTRVKHVMAPGSIYHCEFEAHKVLSQEITRRKATTKVQTKAKPQNA